MSADVRFEELPLWPDDWAIEPPPADPDDDGPELRLAWIKRRYRTIADLPDIAEYRTA